MFTMFTKKRTCKRRNYLLEKELRRNVYTLYLASSYKCVKWNIINKESVVLGKKLFDEYFSYLKVCSNKLFY